KYDISRGLTEIDGVGAVVNGAGDGGEQVHQAARSWLEWKPPAGIFGLQRSKDALPLIRGFFP
ncbi:MAG: hypothetical protein ACU0DI_00725, partial [Paracoccaceae bacterium]